MVEMVKVTEENYKNFEIAWILDQDGESGSLDDPEYRAKAIKKYNEYLKKEIEWGIIKKYFVDNKFDSNETYDIIDVTDNTFTLRYVYQKDGKYQPYFREYNYKTLDSLDSRLKKEADSLVSQLIDTYYFTGYEYLNLFFHYQNWLDTFIYESSPLLYIIPDLKDFVFKNNQFSYSTIFEAGGSTRENGSITFYVFLEKNDIIYEANLTTLNFTKYLYLDKNDSSSFDEKVRKEISDYIKNEDYEIKYSADYTTIIDGKEVPGKMYEIKFNDKNMYWENFLAVEVEKEKIEREKVKATDEDTDIGIETDGYEVPLDVEVKAESKKNDKNLISLLAKYNYEMIDAYNINLYSLIGKNKIDTIQDGVEVFIPIKGYKEGDIITIRHIKDDGSLGEELKGTVTLRNKKLYVKFKTTHFSTYVIIKPNIENPPTGDNIKTYMNTLITSISILSFMGCAYYSKKRILESNK